MNGNAQAAVPLALVGCDFRVAPASLRASLLLSAEERRDLRERLTPAAGASGLAVLDTCNRTEWIVETEHPEWAAELLAAQMQVRLRARAAGARDPRPTIRTGIDAVRHFLRVASGLESLALGEREIAGQCFRALAASRTEGLGSQLLDQLGHAAGRTVRRLERLGRFREASRGVAGMTVEFVLTAIGPIGRQPIIGVAGLGQMGRKCAQALEARGARVVSFNRSAVHSRTQPIEAIAGILPELDALIVSTGAPCATVTLPDSPARMTPLIVVDLGVPPQVAAPEGVRGIRLHGIDDLPFGDRAPHDSGDVLFAAEAVELGVQEFLLACERRRSARLLEVVHAKRTELRDARLPEVLDEHLADLEPTRRRKLEAALSGLLRDQQRALLDAIESGP